MKPRSTTFQIASLLCLFAFVAMQAFGPGRLYLCLCGEQAVIQSKATCTEAEASCHTGENKENPDSSAPSLEVEVITAGGWQHHGHHDHFAVRDDIGAHALAKVSVPEVAWIPLMPWIADATSELTVPSSTFFELHVAERAPPLASPLGRSFHLLI